MDSLGCGGGGTARRLREAAYVSCAYGAYVLDGLRAAWREGSRRSAGSALGAAGRQAGHQMALDEQEDQAAGIAISTEPAVMAPQLARSLLTKVGRPAASV